MESLVCLLQSQIDCLEMEISALKISKTDKEDKVDDLKLLFKRIKQENFSVTKSKSAKVTKERKFSDETIRSNNLSLSTKACSYISYEEYNVNNEYKLSNINYDKICSNDLNCNLAKILCYWDENINNVNQ